MWTRRTVVIEQKTVTVNGKLVSSETKVAANGKTIEASVDAEVEELDRHASAMWKIVDKIFRKVWP
jgi:hypothetical protein